MPNTGFIQKYIVNCQLLQLKLFFSIKYGQSGLLLVSFIELLIRFYDLRYQLVNERTKTLPLNTSHVAIAHLCNQFNHVLHC